MIKKPFPYVNNPGNQSDGVLKDVADLYGKSLRVSDAHSVVEKRWDFCVPEFSAGLPVRVQYYHGTEARRTTFTLGMADTLGGKYFKCYTAPDNHLFTFWFNLNGASSQPVVANTHTYVEIAVSTGDVPQLVGLSIKLLLDNIYSNYFYCLLDETSNANIEIITSQMGENSASDSGTTGFPISQIAGAQELVQDIEIAYNGTEPLFQGQELTGYIFDVYAGKFILRGASEATLQSIDTSLNNIELDIDQINAKLALDFGASSGAIRAAAQIGNATGAANFNAGITGAQTLRTSSNITRNGTELSYNHGAADANSLRVSAQVANATGAANFGAGVTGAQTLRATSNITRNGTELAYNHGAADANTLRTSAQIANSTGAADFGIGAVTAQTLRTASNTLATDPNGVVTTNKESGKVNSNSTNAPLLAGGVFTGAWVDASQYSCISWTINADVDSAPQGLALQFSADGSTIIRQSAVAFTGSANGVFFSFPVHAEFFRIVYTNGPIAQTRFILDVQLHEEYNGLAAVPLDIALSDKSSATAVKAVIAGKSVDGAYQNQRSSGVSTLNSTTIPLAPAATYTGTFEDVVGFSTIAVSVFSNADSATDGLIAEFSSDGINVDHQDFYTLRGGEGNQLTFGVLAKYFRIRFINGGVAQSTFRLSTLYNLSATQASSIRIDDTITGQNDAILVKSVSTGKNPDGFFTNARVQGTESTNSNYTPLGGNTTYRGDWVKWATSYTTLISTVSSDVMGTLYIDASDVPNPTNGSDVDVTYSAVSIFDPAEVPALRKNTPLQSLWIRHRYVNGPAAQTVFNLAAVFTIQDPGSVYLPAHQIPVPESLAAIGRSIETIPNAAGTGYQDIPVDPLTGDPTVTVQTIRDDILHKPMNSVQVEQGVISGVPARIDPSPLANRRKVYISNDGTSNCSIGFSSAITYNSASFVLKGGKERELDVDSSIELWAVAENTGGVTSVLTRTGTTTGGTATSTGNTLLSDNLYANITANGQTATVTGFTAGTVNPLVSVKLGIEANKQSGQFETVTYQDTVTGTAGNVGSVSTASTVTNAIGHLYIVAISRENVNALITGIVGLGINWTQIASSVNGANRILDVWYGIGISSGNGFVTANLSNTALNTHIAVSRYINANLSAPIQDFKTNIANSAAVTTTGVLGTNKGMAYLAAAIDNNSFTAGVGYTERSDEQTPSGSNRDGLATETKSLVSTGVEVPTGTASGSVQYAAISLTITPADAINPRVTLSYELSAVPGATAGLVSFPNTTDGVAIIDITGDRAWVVADIPNIKMIATGTLISAAAANIDQLYLQLTDTTGNTTRISILQTGRSF
jgi:hypothetical protein